MAAVGALRVGATQEVIQEARSVAVMVEVIVEVLKLTAPLEVLTQARAAVVAVRHLTARLFPSLRAATAVLALS